MPPGVPLHPTVQLPLPEVMIKDTITVADFPLGVLMLIWAP